MVTEIKRMHKTGRPVLVGTTSVEKSEVLSAMLTEEGIKHQVLNAKPENVERESEIVAQSGRKGGVTISTNMAGRGARLPCRLAAYPCRRASGRRAGAAG